MHARSEAPDQGDALAQTRQLLQRLMAQSKDCDLDLCLPQHTDQLRRMADALQHDTLLVQQAMLAASARISKLESELARVRELACEDELTRCLNRRGLEQAMERELARAERRGTPLALAIIDLDHFKHINDRLGHAVGDQALVHVTQVAREALRAGDLLARYGGEEFVLILPDTTLAAACQALARVQQALRAQPLALASCDLVLSFSAGVSLRMPCEDARALLSRADQALYCAKADGRDRVVAR